METDAIMINDSLLTGKINDIDSKLSAISNTFENMDLLINNSTTYSNDEIGNTLRHRYDSIRVNFSTIINNINIIVQELNNCKKNYSNQDVNTSILLNQIKIN